MSSIRDFFPIQYRVGGIKPKKNFVLENRKYVTELAKTTKVSKKNENPSNKLSCNHVQKLKLKCEPNKNSIPENSKKLHLDKIDASIKSIRSAISQTKIIQDKLGIKYCDKVSLSFKDQATQTVNPYNEEDLLKDSIIRYPNTRNSNMTKIIQTKHTNTIAVQTEHSKLKDSNCVLENNLKSIQKQNDVNSKECQLHLVGSKENILGHHRPGEIPKYLKDRKALKKKNEKERQKKLAIRHELGLDDPACPTGHILLPEPERLDHLAKIQKDYDHLVMQLNMLPVGSDSYKMKKKRKCLEEELDKLQLGIKLFSREKLFVKVDQKITNCNVRTHIQ